MFRNYKSTPYPYYIAYISIKVGFYNGHEYQNIVKFETGYIKLDAKLVLNEILEKIKLTKLE